MSSFIKKLFGSKDMSRCTILIYEEDGSNERVFDGYACDLPALKKAFPKQKVVLAPDSHY